MVAAAKPKLAVYKFSSCDGCQLSLLNLEEELLEVAAAVEIGYFLEARRAVQPPPYDIGLVEGSVSTPEEEERIRRIRKECKSLITIGACATAGGIQALRNWADVEEFTRCVYAHPEYIKALETTTPIASHVLVDFELRGCPVNRYQLLEVLSALLAGRRPNVPGHSVCVECKAKGTPCVMVAQGKPCLGPVTQAGCGAICPAFSRGCYACFGPMETPNLRSLTSYFQANHGLSGGQIVRMLRSFNGYTEPFKQVSDEYDQDRQ